MKKQLKKLFLIAGSGMLAFTNSKAQTTSSFETLTLSTNSYWNGSTQPLGTIFTDGNAVFNNYYDTAFGGNWLSGWAYSNKKDSTTAGFANQYSARPAIGYAGSSKYAVGQHNAILKLTGSGLGKVVNGLYITNGTYSAISMTNGDAFAKKFGGASGNDPDWFKLTVRKYFGGVLTNDSVEFYLADYRFADNTQDYVVKTWQWVNLTALGNVDSLQFVLSSSDMGQWGMNTPAYFCIDDFTTANSPVAISEIDITNLSISLFPNPTDSYINVNLQNIKSDGAVVEIINATGQLVYSEFINTPSSQIPIEALSSGIYHLKVTKNNFAGHKSFIKQP